MPRLLNLKKAIDEFNAEKQDSKPQEDKYPPSVRMSFELSEEILGNEKMLADADQACYGIMRCTFADLKAKIDERRELLDRGFEDEAFRVAAIEEAKNDPIVFINKWAWTQDPRLVPAPTTIPFVLFPKQEEYIRWRQERRVRQENGIVVKSREMGATWITVACHVHSWLFEGGYSGGIGSRKEMLVDRIGDMSSIFEKMRFVIKCLPPWMKPEYQDNFCKLINLHNGAVVTGESGENIGRGGRVSAFDLDESQFLSQDKKIDAALSETSRVIFWVSTVNIWNPSNIVRSKIRMGTIPVFTLSWRDDPRKDEAWYQDRKAKLDPMIVASEIDMNDSASGEDTIVPGAWVDAAMKRWSDRHLPPTHLGIDVSRGGADETVFAARTGYWIDRLRIFPGSLTPDGDIVAARAIAIAMQLPVESFEAIDYNELRRYAERVDAVMQIDVVGVGASPYDRLRALRVPRVIPLSGGEKSVNDRGYYKTDRTGKLGFFNRRAEWWWNLRELLDPKNGYEVELPPDEELAAELSTPRYSIVPIGDPDKVSDGTRDEDMVMGLIKVESKEDIKKRIGGKSPDRADAVAYAFAETKSKSDRANWLQNL